MATWSKKDERQYDHVLASELERGVSADRASEIAGRTVNKTRRQQGRTPHERTQGTGSPSTPLEARTRDQLYNRARELEIAGRSKLSKHELVQAIRDKQGQRKA